MEALNDHIHILYTRPNARHHRSPALFVYNTTRARTCALYTRTLATVPIYNTQTLHAHGEMSVRQKFQSGSDGILMLVLHQNLDTVCFTTFTCTRRHRRWIEVTNGFVLSLCLLHCCVAPVLGRSSHCVRG